MYSNKIVNFQESTTILNARQKKSGNLWDAPHTTEALIPRKNKANYIFMKKSYCHSFSMYFHWLWLYKRVGWFLNFFLNIKKNIALKVVYIPIKYSYQKLDLNLKRFFANLAWKILNKHELKIPRFCPIWPKYWCKNQTISVFKLGNLILFYWNIRNKL